MDWGRPSVLWFYLALTVLPRLFLVLRFSSLFSGIFCFLAIDNKHDIYADIIWKLIILFICHFFCIIQHWLNFFCLYLIWFMQRWYCFLQSRVPAATDDSWWEERKVFIYGFHRRCRTPSLGQRGNRGRFVEWSTRTQHDRCRLR